MHGCNTPQGALQADVEGIACRQNRPRDENMGGMKTLVCAVCILAGLPAGAEPLTQIFASCTGRFSAELEHAWLMGNPDADLFAVRRARFEDLLNASADEGDATHLLNVRIAAKVAHAQMLTVADFSGDSDELDWARRRLDSEIGYCTSFLLDG